MTGQERAVGSIPSGMIKHMFGALLGLLLFAGGAIATGVLLRVQAGRRGRRLASQLDEPGVLWVGLCRVMAGGTFLDRGRGRRGGAPRGVLVVRGASLEWRPDAFETKHGDPVFQWPIVTVVRLSRRRRRDITGIAIDEMRLAVPEGEVTLGIFRAVGKPPDILKPA